MNFIICDKPFEVLSIQCNSMDQIDNIIIESDWNELPDKKINVTTVDTLEKVGFLVGDFLKMTHREAMSSVKQFHEHAQCVVGFRFMSGSLAHDLVYAPTAGEWYTFQIGSTEFCELPNFITKVYAVHQKYYVK